MLHCKMGCDTLTSKRDWTSIFFSVILVAVCSGVGAEPRCNREMRVAPTDKSATFPMTWPAEHPNLLLILVKTPHTEVAQVTPACIVTGVNSYRARVKGSLTSKGCDVVLSNPVKEDEGCYETRDSKINGTSIPASQVVVTFGDHTRSGGSRNADTSNVLVCGAIILAVYMVCFLPW